MLRDRFDFLRRDVRLAEAIDRLAARQAKSSLRPPPISKAAAKTIQTTALGSLSQFRPALVSSQGMPKLMTIEYRE